MDPADAVAVALLAFTQFQLVLYYGTELPATAMDSAARLTLRGLSLDNNDPLVLVACGGVAHWMRRFDAADALLARARAIDPTSAWAWERYGYSLRPCLSSGVKDGGVQLSHREAADHAIAGFQRAIQLMAPEFRRAIASTASPRRTSWPVDGRTRGFGCTEHWQTIPTAPGSIGTCSAWLSR